MPLKAIRPVTLPDSEEKTFEYDKSERRIKVKQIVHSPIHTSSSSSFPSSPLPPPSPPLSQSQSPSPSQSAKNIDWRDLKGSGSFEDAAAASRERQREWVSEVLKREKKKRNVK
eukprot:gene28283-37210_t